jgi:hypothetical protein
MSALWSRASGIMPISFSPRHHDHRVPRTVDRPKVTHQPRERPRVGVDVRGDERRKDFLTTSARRLGAGETRLIRLHPRRRVRRHAVLPTPEPEQHEPHVVGARSASSESTVAKLNRPSAGSNNSQ